MAAGGMAGDVDAGRIGATVGEMFGEPGDRMADLADNLVHARVGRQGVSDDRDIDAVRQRSLGEEGIPLLVLAPGERATYCCPTRPVSLLPRGRAYSAFIAARFLICV